LPYRRGWDYLEQKHDLRNPSCHPRPVPHLHSDQSTFSTGVKSILQDDCSVQVVAGWRTQIHIRSETSVASEVVSLSQTPHLITRAYPSQRQQVNNPSRNLLSQSRYVTGWHVQGTVVDVNVAAMGIFSCGAVTACRPRTPNAKGSYSSSPSLDPMLSN